MADLPYIPEYITVHLGTPKSNAANVTVSFPDYVKNVASSEIYPTWNENAIRANIYAQISFALNRIYTEYYSSRGYNFDITNSTAYDQYFVYGREIFENISRIADEIFTEYITRQGSVEPLFAQYCNGTTVTCKGLSQWGSNSLGAQGLSPYEILQTYYGTDINIVRSAQIRPITSTAPFRALKAGDFGNDVRTVQIRLNRISANFPEIAKIYPVDGVFTADMEKSVKTFQFIFNLAQDGIVGPATWYKIVQIYNGVKRLNDLHSEGITLDEVSKQFPEVLRRGDRGKYVRAFQYFLAVIGQNLATVPKIEVDGIFGARTEEAVRAFQKAYGLAPDGIVGKYTWNLLFNVYRGIVLATPDYYTGVPVVPFPGYILTIGMRGNDVRLMQSYLRKLSDVYPEIPKITADGIFGVGTRNAVYAFERLFGLDVNGYMNVTDWNVLTGAYSDVIYSETARDGQFGGNELS